MERLGAKYDLLRELGRGAGSIVYLAHDPFAGRDVAIKHATPGLFQNADDGRAYAQQFLTEASLAGKLTHPHIVQIYDAVVSEDAAYIVMEYAAGGTLEPWTEPGRLLPPERVAELIFKCTRALDFAAGLGITHRDIKPANLLLGRPARSTEDFSGEIKISDFGAAITAGTERTQVAGIGSPAYMSPEQVREEPLDFRTDIYSLGVVMYQLLSGGLPFASATHYNMVYQIVHDTPPSLRQSHPDLPPALVEVVERAMARQSAARYQSWEAFSIDLAQAARALRGQPAGHGRRFADSEKFYALRDLPFFADFSDREIWEVVRFARFERVAAGAVVIADSSRGDFFGFVADGTLSVRKGDALLATLTRGACFGEMAVIGETRQPRSADVTAASPARIILIDAEALRHASETCRLNFYRAFLGVLSGRLAEANARLAGS